MEGKGFLSGSLLICNGELRELLGFLITLSAFFLHDQQ